MTFEDALKLLDKKGLEISNIWLGTDLVWRSYIRKKGSTKIASTYGTGENAVEAICAAMGILKKKQDNFEDLL